jgi:hypothetical protein
MADPTPLKCVVVKDGEPCMMNATHGELCSDHHADLEEEEQEEQERRSARKERAEIKAANQRQMQRDIKRGNGDYSGLDDSESEED